MMSLHQQIKDPALRLRMEWAHALAHALRECHPDDAAAICVAYLETVETGGPVLGNPFGMIVEDARLWTAAAPPHELTAYTLAGLQALPNAHLSKPANKRVFNALWRSFSVKERAAFIAAVSQAEARA